MKVKPTVTIMPDQVEKDAAEAMDLPSQFYQQMKGMMEGLHVIFEECNALKEKVQLLQSIEDVPAMHVFIITQWYNACKPHLKKLDKKDHTVFKDLRTSPFVGDLELHKKWKDKRMTMMDRDRVWKFIRNLTQMSQIHAGDSVGIDAETQNLALNFAKRLDIGWDGKKASFDALALKDMLTSVTTNPTGEDMKTLCKLGELFGTDLNLEELQSELTQSVRVESGEVKTSKKTKSNHSSKRKS